MLATVGESKGVCWERERARYVDGLYAAYACASGMLLFQNWRCPRGVV